MPNHLRTWRGLQTSVRITTLPAVLLASAAAALASEATPSLEAASAAPVLPEDLAAGDECPRAASGDGDAGCALSALQRHARSLFRSQQEPVNAWRQCGGMTGGQGWGPTSCVTGFTCVKVTKWYSQCLPAPVSSGQAQDLEANFFHDVEVGVEDEEKEGENEEDEDEEDEDEDENRDEDGEDEDDEDGDAPKDEGKDEQHQVPLQPNPPTLEPRASGPLNPIIIKGNFMYDSITGKRFFAKGVAYNPRNTRYDITWGKSPNCTPGETKSGALGYAADVIADEHESTWGPALKAIANVGANTVRIYNVDPALGHAKFMETAAALGLYVILPLTRKDWGYLPAFPAPDCYTKNIENYGNVGVNVLTTGKLIVKEFSKYNNTLLFTIANEMTVNDKNGFAAFPCVKAYTRDIHRYQASCAKNIRRVPLIYADMDIGDDRTMVGEYMACEVESPDDAVDAYGINVYSWCDQSYPDETGRDNFDYSPYLSIYKGFANFGKPVIFTEFGCNIGQFEMECPYQGGRTWPDVKAITGKMGEVLSGAIAFEFSMERNQYGLALTPGFLSGQDDLYLLDNYYALQRQFREHNISSKWDAKSSAKAMADCTWHPASAAAMSVKHAKAQCPSQTQADMLQRRRGVDKVVMWDRLPGTPNAPLSDVNNQTECPAYRVAPDAYKEGCCHMSCKS